MNKIIVSKSFLLGLFLVFFSQTAFSGELSVQSENKELIKGIEERKVYFERTHELKKLIDDIGKRELVLLGEASHGTSEFYSWRAEITKELVKSGNYGFIAVEGDWASLYDVNNYVKHKSNRDGNARNVLREIERWPLWMWANNEVADFVEWLRNYNKDKEPAERIGFYGMDAYGEQQSAREIIRVVRAHKPDISPEVQERLKCFMDFRDRVGDYIRQVAQGGESCERPISEVYSIVKSNLQDLKRGNPEKYFYLMQNIYVVKAAEAHYRLNISGQDESWNARAVHMFETVLRLQEKYSNNSAGIVWAHNTHIGDASATDMRLNGQVNIGHLSKEKYGIKKVYAVGFSTHRGRVMAASEWEGQRRVFDVPEGISGSLENLLNGISSNKSFYFIMEEELSENNDWLNRIGHRAIGVIYHPERERLGNYVPSVLPLRYNAMIFIPETGPVVPLHRR
ncbi:MAG: erythromycin esterase family protein [Chitinophagaceae bacterium]|nr:MAG: erythromycin esterase family protein [Chitinophagaceae bacterium]